MAVGFLSRRLSLVKAARVLCYTETMLEAFVLVVEALRLTIRGHKQESRLHPHLGKA